MAISDAAAATTRMALRKREPPTSSFVLHRDALISRFSKRPRAERSYDSETDEAESSDTESDYEERRPNRKLGAAARGRATPAIKPTRNVGTSSTDKVLTFLQSAQLQNNPVRSGKWNEDEEAYLRKLVHVFHSGVLDGVETKMSMRMWLAKMLHCCPMRISKKQLHGEKFKGKAKYLRNANRISRMGQKEFDRTCHELHTLRYNFLKYWAKEEFNRWGGADRSRDFGKWYDTVVRNVPMPRLAKNPYLVEPKNLHSMEPWAIARKHLEAVSARQAKAQHERELQRRLLQRTMMKKRAQPAPCPTEDPPATACEGTSCAAPALDLSTASHEDIFEPVQSGSLDVEVDLATLVDEWDGCVATLDIPTKPRSEEHNDHTRLSLLSPSIVLDFGPATLWEAVDPVSKDASFTNHCELVDDLLSDDELLEFDPAMLSATDLPAEPWFQQLCSSFQL